MNLKRSLIATASLLLFILAATFISCVNQDYDLTKDIEIKARILPEVEMPIGDVKPIKITDFLGDLDDSDLLKIDATTGDLYLEFSGGINHEFQVPAVPMNNWVPKQPTVFAANIQVKPGLLPPTGEVEIPFGEGYFKLELTTSVPKEIRKLKYLSINANIDFYFSYKTSDIPFNNIYFNNIQVKFPAWFDFDDAALANLGITNQNNILKIPALKVSKNQSTTTPGLSLPVKGLKAGDEYVQNVKFTPGDQDLGVDGQLRIDDRIDLLSTVAKVKMEEFIVGSPDVTYGPKFSVSAKPNFQNVRSAEIKVTPRLNIDIEPISLEELPDFLKDDDMVLDVTTLRLNLLLKNTAPLAGQFHTNIKAKAGNSPITTVYLGPFAFHNATPQNPVTSAYSVSATGTGAPEGYTNITAANINNLIKPIPDEVKVDDIMISWKDQFSIINLEANYSFGVDYSINTPLCFGPDTKFSIDQDLDLNLNLEELDVKELELKFKIVNTLPVDMAIDAGAYDDQGQAQAGVTLIADAAISAGTIAQPSTTPCSIKAKSSKPININTLKLIFSALGSKNASHHNIPLNKDQYVVITDLSIKLPDGITLDLNKKKD